MNSLPWADAWGGALSFLGAVQFCKRPVTHQCQVRRLQPSCVSIEGCAVSEVSPTMRSCFMSAE